MIRLAGSVGLPATTGVGFGHQNPPIFWIDYARDLQRAIRVELERDGFDGIQIGGEIVVWDFDKINRGVHDDNAA